MKSTGPLRLGRNRPGARPDVRRPACDQGEDILRLKGGPLVRSTSNSTRTRSRAGFFVALLINVEGTALWGGTLQAVLRDGDVPVVGAMVTVRTGGELDLVHKPPRVS